MRDLAFESNRTPNVRQLLVKILIIVTIIAVIYLAKNQLTSISQGADIILKDASLDLKPVPVTNVNISELGINLTTQKTALKDIKYGGQAQATATRAYGGGTYILSVEATLPDPKNTYYQVWLVSENNILPIDYMQGFKNSWSLSLRDADKYSKYDGIWITLERTKDNKPEEHVMEGSF